MPKYEEWHVIPELQYQSKYQTLGYYGVVPNFIAEIIGRTTTETNTIEDNISAIKIPVITLTIQMIICIN